MDSDKRSKPSYTSLVAFGFVVMFVYVLSPGLVVPLANAGYLPENGVLSRVLPVVYVPLTWAYENVECVGSFYDWYFDLWGAEIVTSEDEPSSIEY